MYNKSWYNCLISDLCWKHRKRKRLEETGAERRGPVSSVCVDLSAITAHRSAALLHHIQRQIKLTHAQHVHFRVWRYCKVRIPGVHYDYTFYTSMSVLLIVGQKRSVCWPRRMLLRWVAMSIPTVGDGTDRQMDKRTDTRPLHYRFRYTPRVRENLC